MKKKLLAFVLALCAMLSIPTMPVNAAEAQYGYDPDAAIAYAETHIKEGSDECALGCELVCDQFVKECLNAGGVTLYAGDVEPVMNALVAIGAGTLHEVRLTDGKYVNVNDNPNVRIAKGDVLVTYCEKCDDYNHIVMVSGISEKGNVQTYGHNPVWNNTENFGGFTFTSDNGEKHSGCFKYFVVHMDTTKSSHKHVFKGQQSSGDNLYEQAHPHEMYEECACGVKYYLGWNATVSGCHICNPSPNGIPVVTATYNKNDGSVSLTWTAIEGFPEYTVWRATSENGKYFQLDKPLKSTKFTNYSENLSAGVTYYYKVKARNIESEPVSITIPGKLVLDAPVIKVVANPKYDGMPQVQWERVTNANKYIVERSASPNGIYEKRTITENLSYTNTGLASGSTYYYRVKAVALDGTESAYSNIVSFTYGTVELEVSIEANPSYDGKPWLKWNKVAGAESYIVYRDTSEDGAFKTKYTTNKISLTNTSAVSGNTYYYKVAAVNADGIEFVVSKVISFAYGVVEPEAPEVPETPPVQPEEPENPVVVAPVITSITANAKYEGKPQLKWNKVEGAVSYVVYRDTTADGQYKTQYTTKNLSLTNTSAVSGNTYYYKVVAVFADGSKSADSNVVSFVYGVAEPETPPVQPEEPEEPVVVAPVIAGIVANAKYEGKPQLKWNKVEGAVSYVVYRDTTADGQYKTQYTTKNLSLTNTSAVSGNTYYYKVVAVFADGSKSADSNVVSFAYGVAVPETPPVQPEEPEEPVVVAPVITSIAANAKYEGKPQLKWNKVEGAVSYVVYRDTTADGQYKTQYTTKNLSLTNTSAVSGNIYYYKVVAVYADGSKSGESNVVSFTYGNVENKPEGLTAPVITVTANPNYSGKPQVKWGAVDGAEEYVVYRRVGETGEFKEVKRWDNKSYTNTDVKKGNTYYYYVVAVAADGSVSVASNTVSFSY